MDSMSKTNSNLEIHLIKKLKIRLFLATVESVLLYGSSTWTLTKSMEKSLDGTYTRMLRMVLNVSWREHMTNAESYGTLPKITIKIRERRLKLAGHCTRHPEEEASKLVLWQPQHGKTNRGRRANTFIDSLLKDTGLESVEEMRNAMLDRKIWKGLSNRFGLTPGQSK